MANAPPVEIVRRWRPELIEFVGKAEGAWRDAGSPAVAVSSWYRNEVHNARVGGDQFSQHLAALAADLTGTREQLRSFVGAAKARGLVALDFGTHAHIQLRPAGFLRRRAASRPSSPLLS